MEKIKYIIKKRKPEFDDELLNYLVNYFYIVIRDGLIPDDLDVSDLIDNTINKVDRIVYYNDEDEIGKSLGPDVKGLRDTVSKTIFVSDKLDPQLREITIYHEIHHFAQTSNTDGVGFNQEAGKGRLIMEAQTQYVAEKIFSEIHGVQFEDEFFKTEDVRMLPGGTVRSNLHNYQMYDNLLTKLCIMLDVSKDYIVQLNYQYEFNKGLNILEERYNAVKDKLEFPKSFIDYLYILDYIYQTDYIVYKENEDKEIVKEGKTSIYKYEIHPDRKTVVSLENEKGLIDYIDREYFFALLTNGGNYEEFVKYIIDDKARDLFSEFVAKKKLPNE